MRTAGLVDLQVNGFAGVDFNAGAALDPAAMDHALAAMLTTGVTTCLPTVITAEPAVMLERLQALEAAISASRLGRSMCPGYHVEGPFLNPADGYAGCHPSSAMTAPDYNLIERLEAAVTRPVLLVTIAPELVGSLAFIIHARAAGKLVAIGHSAAGVASVAEAAGAGAAMSTHLGNGLPASLPKLDNTLMAQLAEDRLSASFIADGIHVPPHALKVMLRAKSGERSILVTDATAAAASPPGQYRFAGMTIERSADGTVRVPGTHSLAGSSLCLDAAVRNLIAWGVATPDLALRMASTHPRALLEPALRAHGLDWDWGDVTWTEDWRPQHGRPMAMGEMG
ncbi:MAG: N-acetylglucosamine-6-phosphate deacetylase [Pseudomonadota bacterium]|nr:N-acetylglucosamine-6-phosphate deacetylase [Pseudomonadota bacterium]